MTLETEMKPLSMAWVIALASPALYVAPSETAKQSTGKHCRRPAATASRRWP